MPLIRARRLAAGLAAACAVAVSGGTPALAAPAEPPAAADQQPVEALAVAPKVDMILKKVLAPRGFADGAAIRPEWWSAEEVTLTKTALTYKLTGLPGVKLAGAPGLCTSVSDTELNCANPVGFKVTNEGFTGVLDAKVVASDSATAADTGTLTSTFTAEGRDPITVQSEVEVSAQVNLAAGPDVELSAAPNAEVQQPLEVRNTGSVPVAGTAVVFQNDYAIKASATRFSNCRYSKGGNFLLSCSFDETLAPMASYRSAVPVKLGADTRAPGEARGQVKWLTAAEFAKDLTYRESRGVDTGTPGNAGKITLAQAGSAGRAAQVDLEPGDNVSGVKVTVTGTNGVDLAVVGAELKGTKNAQVNLAVKTRNAGKATVDNARAKTPAALTTFTVPTGTTVVSAPKNCFAVVDGKAGQAGKAGASKYECRSATRFYAGTEESYPFKLKITKVTTGAKGTVTVAFTGDVKTSNNTATVLINKKTTTTTTATPRTGGTAGGGASLPITGPNGAPIALVGLAFVLLGLVAVRYGRRTA